MTMLKLRGISRRQVHQYLIEKGAFYEGDSFRFPDYVVTITDEGIKNIGSIPITELDILFDGKEKSVDQAIDRFKKAFIRMGG